MGSSFATAHALTANLRGFGLWSHFFNDADNGFEALNGERRAIELSKTGREAGAAIECVAASLDRLLDELASIWEDITTLIGTAGTWLRSRLRPNGA